MRILAIDIGGLTQDILLFDSTHIIENCVKMIMPSPTFNLARKIRSATSNRTPVFFKGVNMGGGPSKRALKHHLQSGLSVYSTIGAAATFDDDIEQVESMGIRIIDEGQVPDDVITIVTGDLDLNAIANALSAFNVDLQFDAIAVAVLDHGAAPSGVSDRAFRFQHLKETAQQNDDLLTFAYTRDEIPDYLTRMKSVASSVDQSVPLLLMDTPVAAAVGAMSDTNVAQYEHCVVVNIGNFHTLAFHLKGSRILGFFEHHTRLMNLGKLEDLIRRQVTGGLSDEEIFQDNGHGCIVIETAPEIPFVTVTGPQRHLMVGSNLKPEFAAPHGDMMLTGCFGLLRAYAHKVPGWHSAITSALAL